MEEIRIFFFSDQISVHFGSQVHIGSLVHSTYLKLLCSEGNIPVLELYSSFTFYDCSNIGQPLKLNEFVV